MELLSVVLDTTGNEARSKAEEKIGQDGTEDGGPDDWHVRALPVCLEQHHEENYLNHGSKSSLQDDCNILLWHLARKLLASKTQRVGGRNHSDVVGNEDCKLPFRLCEMLQEC